MNNEIKTKRPPLRGPNAIKEKPKNLTKSLIKMGKYLNKYLIIVIISLLCAAASSVFSIIGPNKLRDLTDELTNGLMLNEKAFNNILTDISGSLNEDRIKELSNNILSFEINPNLITTVYTSGEISTSDKIKFREIINEMNGEANFSKIIEMPESVKRLIFPESSYNDTVISTDDKLAYIEFLGNVSNEDISKNIDLLKKLPYNILHILIPDSKINNVLLTTNDKFELISLMGNENGKSSVDIYKKMDEMPKNIISVIKPKVNFKIIKAIVIFLICIYVLSALFNFIQGFVMAIMSNRFAKELRTKISYKINSLPLKFFDSHSKGDILSRVTNDIDTVGFNLSQSLGSLISALALFIGSIIMMFKTNYILAITAIVSSLFGFLFMGKVLSKSQKYFIKRQEELGKLNGHIEEIYSNHNIVKAYNGKNDASKMFDELNESVFECNRKSQFLSGLMPTMMNFIGNFGYVCVCICGALLVMKGSITFGVIVAFMVYVRLFTSPLSQIAQGMTSIQSTAAAFERVYEFIEEDEMIDESDFKGYLEPKKAKGNIEFNHVKFGYDDNKTVIKDFNAKIKPGEKIAIVGPTGAGKTTMVNLLMKFYDVKSGDILIDNVSIKNLKRENVHDLFIMVLQDTWLFEGTIRENVAYNKKGVSDKKIMEALKVVGIDHFVKSLPGGLDYVINDNESISQGQKQLLTIARGMIKNAPFLILDEATSSVDTRTEELVQKAMDKLTKKRTSFIIAHRLSTIKNADLILVMKDGNIIEQGNHEELMKKKGFYKDLYDSQFKN